MKLSPVTLGAVLSLGLFAGPLTVDAQQARKVYRIGMLETRSAALNAANVDAFREGLRELGYRDGQNIEIVYRSSDGRNDRFPGLAMELVNLKVDVIVTRGTPAVQAAKSATATIPVVMAASGAPVESGIVASLARPGGNLTGTTFLGPRLVSKHLELVKEALPRASIVAILRHPGAFAESTMKGMLREAEAAAKTLRIRLYFADVRSPNELEGAFSTMRTGQPDAFVVFPTPMLFAERRRIVALAVKHRLPSMFNNREAVELGGLMGYGTSILELQRRTATYVDKILKGARPADLPVEQPTKFELVINLKTAKALGLTIPPSLLQRADQVIE